jgi:phosphatidylglycerophosphate synthase
LFVIYHTISGFVDIFDGISARFLHQYSFVGLYFETILDQYGHFIMYICIGLLYPTYIIYFYLEIALELWNSVLSLYMNTLSIADRTWLHKTTFLSTTCSLTIHDHPNLRLLNWYGPDIFHTLLLIRYILIDDNNRRLLVYIKRYISIDKLYLIIRYTLYFTGFFAVLRTFVTSCFLIDKLERLASAKQI